MQEENCDSCEEDDEVPEVVVHPKKPKPKYTVVVSRNTVPHDWECCVNFLIVSFLVLGGGAIGFGGYGYQRDLLWNEVLQGQRPLPTLDKCPYFGGKTFRLNSNPSIRSYLERDGIKDIGFLTCITVSVFVSVVLLCVIRSPGKYNAWYLICGFVNLINGIVLVNLIAGGYKTAQDEAYKKLDAYSKTTRGQLTAETVEQVAILKTITRICRVFPVQNVDLPLVVDGDACGLEHLSELGFCQHYTSKLAAIICCFIMVTVCFLTFFYACCCDCEDTEELVLEEVIGQSSKRKHHHSRRRRAYCPTYPPFQGDYDSNNNDGFQGRNDPRVTQAPWKEWAEQIKDTKHQI